MNATILAMHFMTLGLSGIAEIYQARLVLEDDKKRNHLILIETTAEPLNHPGDLDCPFDKDLQEEFNKDHYKEA